MGRVLNYLSFVFLLLLFLPISSIFVSADFELIVFQEYDKTYFLDGNILRVEKDLVLRNVGSNPVMPGDIRFRVYEVRGGNLVPSEIREIQASDNSRELDTYVEQFSEYSTLVVRVFNPLLPEFDYQIRLSYEINFNPTGILFHEMIFPIEETTIPIRDSSTTFIIPNRYRITYAPNVEIVQDSMHRTIDWDSDDELVLEYTRLPLPQAPFRMVSVFWLSILAVLGVLFIYLNSRRPDGKRKK